MRDEGVRGFEDPFHQVKNYVIMNNTIQIAISFLHVLDFANGLFLAVSSGSSS